jgi:hypothetical protein
MKNEIPKIKVIDRATQHIFFEADLDQANLATEKAAELESLGLDIDVISPTLTQTLLQSLGVNEEDSKTYLDSLDEEIHSHDNSNCSDCAFDSKE